MRDTHRRWVLPPIHFISEELTLKEVKQFAKDHRDRESQDWEPGSVILWPVVSTTCHSLKRLES
jgi:hypothetical protein